MIDIKLFWVNCINFNIKQQKQKLNKIEKRIFQQFN